MTAVLDVTAQEREPLAFLVAVEIGHLAHGTREHKEAGEGLREIYSTLLDAPDGPLQLEFSHDELYLIGVRLYADSSELEEWWLDNRASVRAIRETALFPDDNFGRVVQTFYPRAVSEPEGWSFEPLRAVFLDLGRKIDEALRQSHNTVRGIYNKERSAINNRTKQMQAERAQRRRRRYPSAVGEGVWRPAVRMDLLGDGETTSVNLDGREILVANIGGEFHAIDAVCTHVTALSNLSNLANGRLYPDSMCVECPWHGARFDLRNGKAVQQPFSRDFTREHPVMGRLTSLATPMRTAADTRVYPTKIEGAFVMVNVG